MPFLVLRERYLRDDIACGIIGLCDSPNPTLPARGDLSHVNFPNGHFLLPDTNVFLHQVCPLNARNLFMAQTIQPIDGSSGVRATCGTYNFSPNSQGRSSTSLAAAVQSPQSPH